MGKRIFRVRLDIEAEIELDDHVIDVVDDEWRSMLYQLYTPEDIAQHIAYNLVRGSRLSMLDGWVDQSDENAILVDEDWYFIEATEIKNVEEVGG